MNNTLIQFKDPNGDKHYKLSSHEYHFAVIYRENYRGDMHKSRRLKDSPILSNEGKRLQKKVIENRIAKINKDRQNGEYFRYKVGGYFSLKNLAEVMASKFRRMDKSNVHIVQTEQLHYNYGQLLEDDKGRIFSFKCFDTHRRVIATGITDGMEHFLGLSRIKEYHSDNQIPA